MRILAMTSLYPNPFQPHRAPFNRHWLRLLGERHAVRVISPIAWTDEFNARRRGAAPLPRSRQVALDGLTVDHPRFWFTPRLVRRWYGHFYAASVRRAFDRVAAEFKPELVYAPWAYPDGWAAVRLARRLSVPAVLQVHGSDVLLLDQFPGRKRPTVEAIQSADGIVAVSEDIARRLRALGASADRVRVIHDGVDPAIFHPGRKDEARTRLGITGGEPVLLFIGNLVPVKAIDVLLDACARLGAEGHPVRLFILGQGPLRSQLERRVIDLGLDATVKFMGAMPQPELAHWYRAADCFVLPSHSEGVPNVLLEATACGTPWVASNVGGIPEITREGLSRLVPPNAPAELAGAIRDSLAAPPADPTIAPKLRTDAVAELDDFLTEIRALHSPSSGPVSVTGATP